MLHLGNPGNYLLSLLVQNPLGLLYLSLVLLVQEILAQSPLVHHVPHAVENQVLPYHQMDQPSQDEDLLVQNLEDPVLNDINWLDVLQEHVVRQDNLQEILLDDLRTQVQQQLVLHQEAKNCQVLGKVVFLHHLHQVG